MRRTWNLEFIPFILALIPPALSSLFFPSLHVYNLPFSFQLFCFSCTFSILLILSLSLLYSFHVVSLSAVARSLTATVEEGSLLRELNLELILFILALIPPALSSLFFSTLLVLILPFSFQLVCFSFTSSILLILSLSLLYSFHVVSLSAIARSLIVIVDIGCFSCTFSILLILPLSLLYSFHVVSLSAIARSLTATVEEGSLLRELNLELIVFILALIPPALSVGIGSLLRRTWNLEFIPFILTLIPPALSSLFFPSLHVYNLPFSFQLFCFSCTFSILLILSLSLLYSYEILWQPEIGKSFKGFFYPFFILFEFSGISLFYPFFILLHFGVFLLILFLIIF